MTHILLQLLGRRPAEADMQRHFGVSPPSVHQMVLTLERAGSFDDSPESLVHRSAGCSRVAPGRTLTPSQRLTGHLFDQLILRSQFEPGP
jgi:hypothetical protein